MKRTLLSTAIAGLALVTTAADAGAWQRNSSVTTGRGTYSAQASGGCGGGTCSRSFSATGPYGGTYSRSGSVTRHYNHYDYSRSVTGPHGNTRTSFGSVYPYRPYW
ncbi:MAG: hypothetical protein AB7P02_16880 [Alphaproteobacteria bacterium]